MKIRQSEPEPTQIAFEDDEAFVETMWATPLGGDLYVVHNTPFFQYGVSLGDTVVAHWRSEDLEDAHDEGDDKEGGEHDKSDEPYGFPYVEAVVEKGGHATLRLAVEAGIDDASVEPLFGELASLGCSTEFFAPKLAAIDVPAAVSLDAAMAVLRRSGHEWENGDPPHEEVPGRAAYLVDPRGAELSEDRLGTLALVAGTPPACATCGVAERPVLALWAHAERLRFERSTGVSLSICPACPGRGSVALQRQDDPGPSGPRRTCFRVPELVEGLRYRRTDEANIWSEELPEVWPGPFIDKIGGYPRWARSDETPLCDCGAAMCFVAQLGSASFEHLVGRRAVGYIFVCPHEHAGVFIEQEPQP